MKKVMEDQAKEKAAREGAKPTVTVVICPVAGPPRIEEIGLSLESLRRALGGDVDRPWVESVKLRRYDDGSSIHLFCDEDGVAFGLEPNPHVDGYLGNVVIARTAPDGEQVSLTHADVLDVALRELSR